MIFSLIIFASCSRLILREKYWLNVKSSLYRNFKRSTFFKNSNRFKRYFRNNSFFQILRSWFISALTIEKKLICHFKTLFFKHINSIFRTVFSSFTFAIWLNFFMKKTTDFFSKSNFITSCDRSLVERRLFRSQNSFLL